ncbi:MAG: Smr/MutS family protein [Alphaproteobacteria bacterium]|nr:Smr/MutS family protein [Alphaproteobacteria bacterium]
MTKPGKTRAKKKARPDSPGDERALFEAAMRDIQPLKSRPSPRLPAQAKAAPGMEAEKPAQARKTVRPAPIVTPRHAPAQFHARPNAGLDKRSAERLRRGQMVIDGRLDLHGHTQADAHRAAHAFVAAGYRSGKRCVLIITGKGGAREDVDAGFMPDRDSGVLRRNLPRWLGEPSVRHMVLRLESARPQHGGDGAYYVLLRRKR